MKKLPSPAQIFGVLCLSFIADSHAIDRYDPVTKKLTIPQVLVDDTTYNNVVLKLNAFELLDIDPSPSVGILNGGFMMQFVSATIQGGIVKITLTLTSQGKDKTAYVGFCGDYKAKFTDDQGNVYNPETVEIRNKNKTNGGCLQYAFDADIPSTAVITYNDVAANAKSIGLLDLKILPDVNFKIGNILLQNLNGGVPFK